MKRGKLFILFSLVLLLISCTQNNESTIVDLKTKHFEISISNKGSISNFTDLKTQINHLSKDTITYLMSLRIDNEIKIPQSAKAKNDIIILTFENDIDANIKIEEKDSENSWKHLAATNTISINLKFEKSEIKTILIQK